MNSLTIRHVEQLGCWVVLLEGSEGYHAYLHTDLEWRANCIGPTGATGHWPNEDAASDGLQKWMAQLPEFTTLHHRKGSRIVKLRKRDVLRNHDAETHK